MKKIENQKPLLYKKFKITDKSTFFFFLNNHITLLKLFFPSFCQGSLGILYDFLQTELKVFVAFGIFLIFHSLLWGYRSLHFSNLLFP